MNVVEHQAESVNPGREAFDDGEIELRKRRKLRTGMRGRCLIVESASLL